LAPLLIYGNRMNTELMITKVNGVDRYVSSVGSSAENYLRLTFHQSVITLTFFITYTIFQPPATILCRKIGPLVFLSLITLLWGGVMIGFGFAKDWTHLVAMRAVLGILEVFGPVDFRMKPLLTLTRPVSSLVLFT
jgi:MFS family permease